MEVTNEQVTLTFTTDSSPTLLNMAPSPKKDYHTIYAICRTLPTFSSLSDSNLKSAINTSIATYLPSLSHFDKTLPAHFHRKSDKAAWLEFTCVTIHNSNLLAGFCLSPLQASAMMNHVDLLYRVDDFMETLFEAYGILDMSAAFEALQRCFGPYLSSPIRSKKIYRGSSRKIDYPVTSLPPIASLLQLEQDLRSVIEHMHSFPICDAPEQDRQWYSLELYDFFVAQLEQLDDNSEQPKTTTVTRGQLHQWVTNIGARSVGTKYMFAMFSCLVSAVDGKGKEALWKTASESFLAQEFAQLVSVEFRILNDIGGRARDEREGVMSCCSLVGEGEEGELLKIAEFAAESSKVVMEKLVGCVGDGWRERARDLLEMYRLSVRISGELYLADEPNRSV